MKQYIKARYPDLVRIGRLMSYELSGWAVDLRGRLSPRQRQTLRTLRNATGLKLNIASGRSTHTGWINVDVSSAADIRMDLRRAMPLRDGSAALIFCEHFCDHLNYPDVISRFLSDCHRLLAPGGRARFVLHDAEGLMRAHLARDNRYFDVSEISLPTRMEAVNLLFRFNDFHQFLYDYETFERLLRLAGFARVEKASYQKSDFPELVLDQIHPSREMMSMYVEAIK